MQIYFITRGHYDQVNRFINDLLAQKYERVYQSSGKVKIGWHVRPIQLWEIAVPKEELDKVLGALGGSNAKGIPSSFLWAFRKALSLKPINKVYPPVIPINRSAVQMCLIGYREDSNTDNGIEIL